MNLVSSLSSEQKITTIELRDLINASRKEAGEPQIENRHFIARVEDELDDLPPRKIFTHPSNGQESYLYELTLEQATLVGMRESKSVRRAVLDVLKEKANPVPQTYIGALKALVAAEEAKEAALQLANQAIATKAEIGNRREATAMNTASQAVKKASKLEIELDKSKEYASIKRMEMAYHGQKFNWRMLKAAATEMEMPPIDIFDANYGTVKAYHADVWREVYALEVI